MSRLSILSSLLLSLILISCTENSVGTQSGTVWGHIVLYGDGVNNRLTDLSGVSVSIVGTGFTTTTSSDGEWRLEDVPAGVHTLRFEREGFGEYQEQIQYVGNGAYYLKEFPLHKIPSYRVEAFTATVGSSEPTHIRLTVSLSDPTLYDYRRSTMIFYSLQPDNFELISSRVVGSVTVLPDSVSAVSSEVLTHIKDRGIASGTTIYLRAFPSSYYAYPYYDPEVRAERYTSISSNGSEVVSVVLP
ncbi:MAG: carboxypeptidase regulatory-like domain-containing protein [Candidatus Kapaibacterium sp.]